MRASRLARITGLGALLVVASSSSAIGQSLDPFRPGVDFSADQVAAIRRGRTTDKMPFNVPARAADLEALSQPVDDVSGGCAYGTIGGRKAIVQDGCNGEIPQSRIGAIAHIGGDLCGIDVNGGHSAARLLTFTGTWFDR